MSIYKQKVSGYMSLKLKMREIMHKLMLGPDGHSFRKLMLVLMSQFQRDCT